MSPYEEYLLSLPDSPLTESLRNAYSALLEEVETEIAKNPQEYGLTYLERKYKEFRDRFFGGNEGYLPESLPIGFCNTLKALGYCQTRTRMNYSTGTRSVLKCEIKLSNSYDFTPKLLDEVLLHEMIHAYLAYSPDRYDNTDGHGPRFIDWCNRINSMSDYHITVKNDTPITLNNGMANRISNDGTILVIARDTEPGKSSVSRINQKDTDWALPRFRDWLKKDVKCYACSDANFKRRFTTAKTRLSALVIDNSMIDDMIASGILKEISVTEGTPQNGVVIAWPWFGDRVSYSLVDRSVIPMAAGMLNDYLRNNSMEPKVSLYKVAKYFPGWSKPTVKSMGRGLPNMSVGKNEFNAWVNDGTLEYIRDLIHP